MITIISLIFGFLICILCILAWCLSKKIALPILLVAFWHLTKVPFYVISPIFAPQFIEPYRIEIGELIALFSAKLIVFVFFMVGYFTMAPKCADKSRSFKSCSFGFLFWNLILGLFFIFTYWYFTGGISSVIDSLSNRAESTRGNIIFISIGWSLIGLAVVCSVNTIKLSTQFILLIFLSVLLFVSYGSRSLSGGMFVIWMISFYIFNKKIPFKLFSVWPYLGVFLGVVVFVGAPLLRVQGAIDSYLADGFLFVENLIHNWFEVLERFAVPQIEFLVLRHFNLSNYWLGSSFLDSLYFFCPLVFCSNKPPIDEGVYLYNIYLFGNVAVGTPGQELELSSLPFETWSIWYANFGLIGVVLGGWLQGICLGGICKFFNANMIYFRCIKAYSIALIGLGFYNITNLSIGLFFFPLLLAVISASVYSLIVGVVSSVRIDSRGTSVALTRSDSAKSNYRE